MSCLADAAAYTFSERYNANPDGDLAALRLEIVAAFCEDARGIIEEAMCDFCADAINDIFVLQAMEKCRPLTASLDTMIPGRSASLSACLAASRLC